MREDLKYICGRHSGKTGNSSVRTDVELRMDPVLGEFLGGKTIQGPGHGFDGLAVGLAHHQFILGGRGVFIPKN
ncbi:hypothetical protein OLK001_16520 [Synechocystis sp. LKSZ1]